jgi:hypothetical protein
MDIDDLDDPTMSLNVEEFLIHKDGQKELTPEEEDALLQGGSVDAVPESALPPSREEPDNFRALYNERTKIYAAVPSYEGTVGGIPVKHLTVGKTPRAYNVGRTNVEYAAAYLWALQHATGSREQNMALPTLIIPPDPRTKMPVEEKFFTAPNPEGLTDDVRQPDSRMATGFMRKILYLAFKEPRASWDISIILEEFQKGFKRWGIEVPISHGELAPRLSPREENVLQTRREEERQKRKEMTAKLNRKWEEDS